MKYFSYKVLLLLSLALPLHCLAVKFRVYDPAIVGGPKSYEVEVLPYVSVLSPTEECFGVQMLLIEPFFRSNWTVADLNRERSAYVEKILLGIEQGDSEGQVVCLKLLTYPIKCGVPYSSILNQKFAEQDGLVREAAVRSVESNHLTEFAPQLFKMLRDPDLRVRLAVCEAILTVSPERSSSAFPVLVEALAVGADHDIYPVFSRVRKALSEWLRKNPEYKDQVPQKYQVQLEL